MADQNDPRDKQWLINEIESDLIGDFGSKEALEEWRNSKRISFANKKIQLLNKYPMVFDTMENKINELGFQYELYKTSWNIYFVFYDRFVYIKYPENDMRYRVEIDDIFTIVELLTNDETLLEISPSICQLQTHFKSINVNVDVKRYEMLFGSWYVTIKNDQNKTIGCYNNPLQISDNFINTKDADHFEVLASGFDCYRNNQTVDDIINIIL